MPVLQIPLDVLAQRLELGHEAELVAGVPEEEGAHERHGDARPNDQPSTSSFLHMIIDRPMTGAVEVWELVVASSPLQRERSIWMAW